MDLFFFTGSVLSVVVIIGAVNLIFENYYLKIVNFFNITSFVGYFVLYDWMVMIFSKIK